MGSNLEMEEETSIDALIENEDYLMLREFQMRQWRYMDEFPRLIYEASQLDNSQSVGAYQNVEESERGDEVDPINLNQSHLHEGMSEEKVYSQESPGKVGNEEDILEMEQDGKDDDIGVDVDQDNLFNKDILQSDVLQEQEQSNPLADPLPVLDPFLHPFPVPDPFLDPLPVPDPLVDPYPVPDPIIDLDPSYSFMYDIKTNRYDKLSYCKADVKTERGNIEPIKSKYSKEEVDMMMDLEASTNLERFQVGREIIPGIISKDHPFLLSKSRALIIAETGVKSACLYQSLAEWLHWENNRPYIASLPYYYREWYNYHGPEYKNKKLSHSVGIKTKLALQLRDAINTEMVCNADTLFEIFPEQMLGDDYKNAKSLRHEAELKRYKDHMGGTLTDCYVLRHVKDTYLGLGT